MTLLICLQQVYLHFKAKYLLSTEDLFLDFYSDVDDIHVYGIEKRLVKVSHSSHRGSGG